MITPHAGPAASGSSMQAHGRRPEADTIDASEGGHLHDAPPAMAIVLVLLAVGSVAAGYVGVPAVLGGSNRIEHFLAPSFAAPGLEDARRARRQSRRSPSRDGLWEARRRAKADTSLPSPAITPQNSA